MTTTKKPTKKSAKKTAKRPRVSQRDRLAIEREAQVRQYMLMFEMTVPEILKVHLELLGKKWPGLSPLEFAASIEQGHEAASDHCADMCRRLAERMLELAGDLAQARVAPSTLDPLAYLDRGSRAK